MMHKTNIKGFVKDEKSGAILNMREKDLESYKAKIQKITSEKKIVSLEEKIQRLEKVVSILLQERNDGQI